MGWFTLCGTNLSPELVPFQKQVTSLYNETGVLLAIHPEAFEAAEAVNQKLPLTIYESVSETEPTKEEGSMQVDGEETSDIKFRPVPYAVDTDEAEMIAIDYVAKGAGSASAVSDAAPQTTTTTTPPALQQPPPEDKKGKKRADPPPSSQPETSSVTNGAAPALDTLTPEEQDQIASIQTRLNSVRMLQMRLNLLTKFLTTLPPSYITDQSIALTPTSPAPNHLPHLRNIQALLTRLNLLTPAGAQTPSTLSAAPTSLEEIQQSSQNDVTLTTILAAINKDVQALGELGRKFATVESARSARKKGQGYPLSGGFGGAGGMGDLAEEYAGGMGMGMGMGMGRGMRGGMQL